MISHLKIKVHNINKDMELWMVFYLFIFYKFLNELKIIKINGIDITINGKIFICYCKYKKFKINYKIMEKICLSKI